MTLHIEYKAAGPACIPMRANPTDAGADLVSIDSHTLEPSEQKLFNTGFALKIPKGFVGMVCNRSSQGKKGVTIPHSVGIIDSDYRGNILVLLRNDGSEPYEVKSLVTKIAQLLIVPIVLPEWKNYTLSGNPWDDTARGTGGFGSTGA